MNAGPAAHILVIDDEARMAGSLRQLLEERGFTVSTALSAKEGLRVLQRRDIHLVLCDIVMPDMSGLLLLSKIGSGVPVVMMTAYASIETARRAFKLGAADYLVKPFELEELLVVIRQNLGRAREGPTEAVAGLLQRTRNSAFRQVLDLAEKFSRTDMPVLLTGESGVGKELIAQLIHRRSRRRDRPMLSINCAAIPETLLESELFGYEKGAFTGAAADRVGRFEEADGGVLFLDEVGDMPPSVQAKMLRVLQDFQITRLGGTANIRVDIRLIAATNRPVEQLIGSGSFRPDLYHRLNGLTLNIPPLRERPEDLPLLVAYFIEHFGAKYGKPIRSAAAQTMRIFERYPWPGNVRELKNCLERAVVVSEEPFILPEHLPDTVYRMGTAAPPGPAPSRTGADVAPEDYRTLYMRRLILDALARSGGNRNEAAHLLKISRKTLYNRMKELDIRYDFS